MSASTENRSLWREVLKSEGLIFKTHSCHFHDLSILFLLPIFFSVVVYPSFHLSLFHPHYDFTIFTQPQFSHLSFFSFEIIVPILYTVFLVILFLCAIATITYSTVHASYGRPINFVSSIKSIKKSFFPLLSTFIISHTIFISITLIFSVLVHVLPTLGLIELKYDSNHLLFLVIFTLIVLAPILVWLQVNWSLAYVIAVVEFKWGFETLRRSAYLVKGMRSVALSMMLLYGLMIGGMVAASSMFLVIRGTTKGDQWWILLGIILQTLKMNQYLMVNAVLYMYCKDLNDENLPFEIENEFANHYIDNYNNMQVKYEESSAYISLPLSDENSHAIV